MILPPSNKFVLASNYMSGSVCVYARNDDGSLGALTSFHQYEGKGSGVNPARQEGPHAHMCLFDPSAKYVFVPDLGDDVVRVYTFNHDTGELVPKPDADLAMPPGSGPRHMAFHPTLPVAYIVNELLSTMSTCTFDPASGKLTIQSTLSTLPAGVDGSNNTCAAIRVLADGSAVYQSNRGHHSITRFTLAADGMPTWSECTPAGGDTPRDFCVLTSTDGAEQLMLVAAQDSDVITSFTIGAGGVLAPTGHTVAVKSPSVVCRV